MKRTKVSIRDLLFDPNNPRLPLTRREGSVEEIINYFIQKENIFELISSIGEQGWIEIEPILVVPNANNKYTVVEGNRRLASLLLLNNPELASIKRRTIEELVGQAKYKPNEIEVLVYKNRSEVLNYLGYRHITGVDEWDSLAKARYLKQLAEHNHHMSGLEGGDLNRQLAKIIGSRADYVQKLLQGFALYEEIRDEGYYDTGLNDENFSFSLLTTAISYKNINDYVELKMDEAKGSFSFNKDHLRDLVEWVFEENKDGEKRVSESRELKTLNHVVGNERALKVFKDENKPLEYARRFTEEPLEFFDKALEDAHKLVDAAIGQMQFIEKMDERSQLVAQRLHRKTADLRDMVHRRTGDDDD